MRDKKAKTWYSKVKNRLHLDTKTNKYKARNIVKEENVITHTFFPFIHFEIKQFKLSKKLKRQEIENEIIDPYKRRDIYYSCHSDSYIFSYYNELLLAKYNKFLSDNNLHCSIAYRHIDKNEKHIGKSNIDFVAEAFKEIDCRENCFAIGLDIHGFFDNLNHAILYNNLCQILNCEILPNDWYKIYKILTAFHFIDLGELLQNKNIQANRRDFWDEDTHSFERICSPETFRKIIKERPDIIQKNPHTEKNVGIPQGTNISGTLANIYMANFDLNIQKAVDEINGYYRRYSDDILIITNTKKDLEQILNLFESELNKLELDLSKDKTICCNFVNHTCNFVPCRFKEDALENGFFQYLGFTYNGTKILVRNGTIGCFWRDAFRHIRKIVLNNYFARKKIPISKIYGLYSHLSNRKSEYGNFYHYIRKSQRIFEKDYGFKNRVYIKAQMSKSWEILHKYLDKLKKKYNISDKYLSIPQNIII